MKSSRALILGLIISLFPLVASAHVKVAPTEAGYGAFQTFTVSVPSEKAYATTMVRLLLPQGLDHVTPTVKSGWKVVVKRDSTGVASEIDWLGGKIPGGERDDFSFSVQVPGTATTLVWKAYQTYADGSVVAWDQDPNAAQPKSSTGAADFSKQGPYSTTKIVDDLAAGPGNVGSTASEIASFALSVMALVVAGLALSRTR